MQSFCVYDSLAFAIRTVNDIVLFFDIVAFSDIFVFYDRPYIVEEDLFYIYDYRRAIFLYDRFVRGIFVDTRFYLKLMDEVGNDPKLKFCTVGFYII